MFVKDLHVKPDALNLIEKEVGSSLEHISTGENFLNRGPRTQALKSTIDKLNLIKLKSFFKAKNTLNRTKWQTIDFEKIFTNPTPDRGLIAKLYKELKKLDSRKPNNHI